MIKGFLWLPFITIFNNQKKNSHFQKPFYQWEEWNWEAQAQDRSYPSTLQVHLSQLPFHPNSSQTFQSSSFFLQVSPLKCWSTGGIHPGNNRYFCQIKLFNVENTLELYKLSGVVFCCCCFVSLWYRKMFKVPHRKIMFYATSFGAQLNWQINLHAVFNLHYLLLLLRRPHLHMNSFPNVFQKLKSCKLKIHPYTWKRRCLRKYIFCFCIFSSTLVDEKASVTLFLTLKEIINQIIPNMNRKQCNWMGKNRYSKEQPWLFFKEKIAKKLGNRWLKVLDEDTFSYAN